MLRIGARADIAAVVRAFGVADSQLPFAAAKALTMTGQDVKKAEETAIRGAFLNATPYTQRSVFLQTATKRRLEAKVWLKDVWFKDGEGHHYLEPQIFGGGRSRKPFEVRLQMTGYMGRDERAVPAVAARMNAYGNMSPGQVNQILSQLSTAVIQGDYTNASNSRRSRAKRSVVQYFVSQGPGSQRKGYAHRKPAHFGQHLPRGVWERRTHAWGITVRPVLLFVKAARYSPRLDFFDVANRVISATLRRNAEQAVTDAMKTARFRVQGGLW